MRAKKTDKETRQEQIVESALKLIGAEGTHALSIARIAKQVGIVPSAVYRHFKSKDEILDAVLILLKNRLLNNVAAAREETSKAPERLKSLLMRHIHMLSENQAVPQVVFSEGIHSGHPERKDQVREIMSKYLGKIQDIVLEGQQDGTIRKDVMPKTIAVMFLGLILPSAVLWNVTEGQFDVVANAEKIWPVFERGVVTDTSISAGGKKTGLHSSKDQP